jgi:ribosomal RNA-processing protein 7
VKNLRHKPGASGGHEIFLKEHKIKATLSDGALKNILMAANLPPYLTNDHIRTIFKKFGDILDIKASVTPITDVSLIETAAQTPSTDLFNFKIAYITYKSYKGLEKALSLKNELTPITEIENFSSGIARWYQEYEDDIKDEDELQTEIDSFMATYEDKEQNKSNVEEETDGWVTVTKDSAKAFQQKESMVNKVEDKLEKLKKKKELNNFYTFQIRESKRKDIISLRTKYSQDEKKMEAIKKNRKYKPY